jgi:hypothetical protein
MTECLADATCLEFSAKFSAGTGAGGSDEYECKLMTKPCEKRGVLDDVTNY